MAHYKILPNAHGPRTGFRIQREGEAAFCGTLDPVDPSPALSFRFGNLEPKTFSSYATWRTWFAKQGHTVEMLP